MNCIWLVYELAIYKYFSVPPEIETDLCHKIVVTTYCDFIKNTNKCWLALTHCGHYLYLFLYSFLGFRTLKRDPTTKAPLSVRPSVCHQAVSHEL